MRQAVLRVSDAGRNEIARVAAPVEANHHFRIEIHAAAKRDTLRQRQRRRDRIDAKSAHAVFQTQGEGFNPHPDVSHPAAIQARARDRVIVHRLAGNQRVGMALGLSQELRDIFNGVLPIGVHLHRMAVTRVAGNF